MSASEHCKSSPNEESDPKRKNGKRPKHRTIPFPNFRQPKICINVVVLQRVLYQSGRLGIFNLGLISRCGRREIAKENGGILLQNLNHSVDERSLLRPVF